MTYIADNSNGFWWQSHHQLHISEGINKSDEDIAF
jgi:hypothetical protein